MESNRPKDRDTLAEYCLRRLGKGMVQINVTEDQISDRIDDTIDFFVQFHFEGIEKKYTKLLVDANTQAQKYFVMPKDTVGVTRIFVLSSEALNSNQTGNFNMFDLNYQIRLNELYDFTSADYVYFELANQHIRTLEMLFVGDKPIRYNRYVNKLYIDMDWYGDIAPGQYVIAEVYTLLPENNEMFWNDRWLKAYATAAIKKQWGENLKKYKGTPLPGGLTVDGQGMFDEAVAELTKLEQEVRDTFELPAQWEVG